MVNGLLAGFVLLYLCMTKTKITENKKSSADKKTEGELTSSQLDALAELRNFYDTNTQRKRAMGEDSLKNRLDLIAGDLAEEKDKMMMSSGRPLNDFFGRMIAENPVGVTMYFIEAFLKFDGATTKSDLEGYVGQLKELTNIVVKLKKACGRDVKDNQILQPLTYFIQRCTALIGYAETLLSMPDKERAGVLKSEKGDLTSSQAKHLREKKTVENMKKNLYRLTQAGEDKMKDRDRRLFAVASGLIDTGLVNWGELESRSRSRDMKYHKAPKKEGNAKVGVENIERLDDAS